MTKLYTTLCFFISFMVVASAQLKITEISYNPPESGTDSLEYIEIYNAGSVDLNLEGYTFSKGVDLTFPNVVLKAGAYLLTGVNADVIERNFNVQAIQWNGGALANGGEAIAISDRNGNEIFSVTYQTAAPWPVFAEGANGGGRSIELCNFDADPNDGENWKVSENDLGFQINGRQVYGTPGAANSVQCGLEADYTVEILGDVFSPQDITINEGETVRWVNISGNNNINGDKSIFANNPVSFGNGDPSTGNWTYDFKFDVPGYYEYQSEPSGYKGSVTVVEKAVVDLYPYRTIPEVKGVNANGVADSLGRNCTLIGVVHSINFRPTGLQFVIVDAQNKGFAIFNNSNNFGYTVTPGDEVEVKGKIDQFRGLSQLVVDSVKVLSGGNALVDLKVVDEFIEEDESSYVQITNVSFVDPAQWTSAGSGFNVDMSNGTQQYLVRIVNTSDAFSAPIPAGEQFNVTGVLSQFAGSSAPYIGGYQLQPSYIVDFDPITSVTDQGDFTNVVLSPNPVTHQIQIDSEIVPQRIVIMDTHGNELNTLHNVQSIDFSAKPSGLYLVKLEMGQKTIVKKVIKI